MLMKLDFTSEVPIYRQIHDQLVMGIADGRLQAGENLPTVRALANETGVNVMTINKAYQLLKQEGHIQTDRRKGTLVAGNTVSKPCETTLSELKLTAATAKLSGVERDEWLELCSTAYDSLCTS
ncbi:MAG: GntR family transcriptional regulator [Oscillospiraceae bacterium]|nr:GntR family transcriptional regulator [Oscillospiraceae bacterium]